MNCPGQDPTSPFFATLKDSKQWLDPGRSAKKPLANHSQFKCYDGWSMLNQVQPAPYDGMYKFPSVDGGGSRRPGKPTQARTAASVLRRQPRLGTASRCCRAGKYVVEVIVPPGYELVKEEDKNILLGDVYIAPVTQQFAGFGNIFIMPDQAAVNAYYNKNNPAPELDHELGATPRHEGDTGSVEQFWPCVGAERIVPDLNSLFPGAGQARAVRRRLAAPVRPQGSDADDQASGWRSSTSSARRTSPVTSPARSPTTSRPSSTRSRRSSARSSARRTCRSRCATSPATRWRASTPTSGASTTACTSRATA